MVEETYGQGRYYQSSKLSLPLVAPKRAEERRVGLEWYGLEVSRMGREEWRGELSKNE